MTTILLIIHLLIAIAMVGVILLQRSEGGALGIGGGGSGGGGGGFGGLMSGRASANLLTRTTAFLAMGFIATSLILAIVAARNSAPTSILDQPVGGTSQTAPEATAPEVPAAPAEPSAPTAD